MTAVKTIPTGTPKIYNKQPHQGIATHFSIIDTGDRNMMYVTIITEIGAICARNLRGMKCALVYFRRSFSFPTQVFLVLPALFEYAVAQDVFAQQSYVVVPALPALL